MFGRRAAVETPPEPPPAPPVVNGLRMVRRFGPGDPRFRPQGLPVIVVRAFGLDALREVAEWECHHGQRVVACTVWVEKGIVRCRSMDTAATAATGKTRHGDWGGVPPVPSGSTEDFAVRQRRHQADVAEAVQAVCAEWAELVNRDD